MRNALKVVLPLRLTLKSLQKNLNFGIIDQSAALVIRFDSGGDFSVGNFSCLDLPVNNILAMHC